jgi:hypothetical protein
LALSPFFLLVKFLMRFSIWGLSYNHQPPLLNPVFHTDKPMASPMPLSTWCLFIAAVKKATSKLYELWQQYHLFMFLIWATLTDAAHLYPCAVSQHCLTEVGGSTTNMALLPELLSWCWLAAEPQLGLAAKILSPRLGGLSIWWVCAAHGVDSYDLAVSGQLDFLPRRWLLPECKSGTCQAFLMSGFINLKTSLPSHFISQKRHKVSTDSKTGY